VLLTVLVGGHLFDAISYREHWPFSNYPMFDGVALGTVTEYQLACLTHDLNGHPVTEVLQPDWLPSLPSYKIQNTLRHELDGKDPNMPALRRLLEDYLAAYNSYQRTGQGGPVAYGLRLYRVEFPLEVPLRKISLTDPASPYVKLAMEVLQPTGRTTSATTRPQSR